MFCSHVTHSGIFFLTQTLLPLINHGGNLVNISLGLAQFTWPGYAAYASANQMDLGRVGVPEDIGGAIASLLSEDNRWINGQRIEVSGGMFL